MTKREITKLSFEITGLAIKVHKKLGPGLLDTGSYNVNEVGLKIGYSTGSHFIAAFKKKYATTPKKYLMSINPNT